MHTACNSDLEGGHNNDPDLEAIQAAAGDLGGGDCRRHFCAYGHGFRSLVKSILHADDTNGGIRDRDLVGAIGSGWFVCGDPGSGLRVEGSQSGKRPRLPRCSLPSLQQIACLGLWAALLLQYFEPVRLYVGVLGLAIIAYALWRKASGTGCQPAGGLA